METNMSHKGKDRRSFLKRAMLSLGAVVWINPVQVGSEAGRFRILSALGDTLIPSKPGDPGFVDLEPHGIVQAVSNTLVSLADKPLEQFNQAPKPLFQGRTFLELDQDERVTFLKRVIASEDAALKRVYKLVRVAVLNVFYSNFPEHKVARDGEGVPILKPGDQHQITNPNTDRLVTGWDVAGYRGPLSWEQEEQMRASMEKVHWHDDLEDLIVRYRPKGR